MDVFYYWKDIAQDLKAGRIGRFRSHKDRLEELHAGYPDHVWVFKTPPGRKGQLQLKARLCWSNSPPSSFKPEPGVGYIYYDPDQASSVWFDDSDTDAAIEAATRWAGKHFPSAVQANFQGVNGQHPMRGPVLKELEALAASLPCRPFRTAFA